MGKLTPRQEEPNVPTRVAPRPISSGLSFKKLPPANISEIEKTIDFHLAQCQGRYEGPASRHLFDMANEIKTLLAPVLAEDTRKSSRVNHLEGMLRQWHEVFGSGGSPLEMKQRLSAQEAEIESLRQRLADAQHQVKMAEKDCKAMLAQHLRAHQAELQRVQGAEVERRVSASVRF